MVSGPGVVHGLAGLANAQQNCWPMILIGGASPAWQNGMGAFQEERQVQIATPFCKFAHAVEHVHRIPFYVEMAVRNVDLRPARRQLSRHAGRHHPRRGGRGQVDEPARCPEPPRMQATPEDIDQALNVLRPRSGRW